LGDTTKRKGILQTEKPEKKLRSSTKGGVSEYVR